MSSCQKDVKCSKMSKHPNNVKLSKWCQMPKIALCRLRWFKFNWCVKMWKRCQVVKKMSNIKKSNMQTIKEVHKKKALCGLRWFKLYVSRFKRCQIAINLGYGGGSQKEQIDIMRFTHIDVNFDVRYEGHQNCPKILSMDILRAFSDHDM